MSPPRMAERDGSRMNNPRSSPGAERLAGALNDYDDAEELEEIEEIEDFVEEDVSEEELSPPKPIDRSKTAPAVVPVVAPAAAAADAEEEDDDGSKGEPLLLSRAAAAATNDPKWASVVHAAIHSQVLRFNPQYAGQVIAAHSRFQEVVEEALDKLLELLGIEQEELAFALIGTAAEEIDIAPPHMAVSRLAPGHRIGYLSRLCQPFSTVLA